MVSLESIFAKGKAHKQKLLPSVTMEALDHSFSSAVHLLHSRLCDLFLLVIRLTASYLSMLEEILHL